MRSEKIRIVMLLAFLLALIAFAATYTPTMP